MRGRQEGRNEASYPPSPKLLNATMRTEKVMSADRAQEIQMSIFMDFGVLTPSLSPQTEIILSQRRICSFVLWEKQPEGPCRCSDISVMTLVAFVKKQSYG